MRRYAIKESGGLSFPGPGTQDLCRVVNSHLGLVAIIWCELFSWFRLSRLSAGRWRQLHSRVGQLCSGRRASTCTSISRRAEAALLSTDSKQAHILGDPPWGGASRDRHDAHSLTETRRHPGGCEDTPSGSDATTLDTCAASSPCASLPPRLPCPFHACTHRIFSVL